ncbi:Plancitoxin-1 [Frankliniella fusca]|uniref:Plancitoxin-1 n=1 Tax=Frankliniella fusca TaxID=407009 RepID=A0AAE1HD36_9NEOP|nr:Plancitoxin-1 [Frankliniella fusca]
MDLMGNLLFAFLSGVLLWSGTLSSDLQCKDENDKTVDWFVAIKLPRLKKSEDANVKEGVAYVFITSDSVNRNWTLSSKTVRDPNSVMGNTLRPLYNEQVSKFARLLYNDEPWHGDTTLTLGHTKGVVAADRESGFWLIHSVPHFPPEASNNEYSYPDTGVMYGQSFLCITVPPEGIETIGKQLTYNEPDIYDAEVPDAVKSQYPSLVKATKGDFVKSAPWFNSAQFSSINGQSFVSYAKSKHFGKDIYADWVAQDLKTNLQVETWNHGPGSKMQSECGKPFKVENIEGVSLDSISFRTGEDHSKWAVSSSDDKPWVCIGDINRMVKYAFLNSKMLIR